MFILSTLTFFCFEHAHNFCSAHVTPASGMALYGLNRLLKCRGVRSYSKAEPVIVFYRWPTMKHFRFISRLKMYQVSGMLLLLVPMTFWHHLGAVNLSTLTFAWVAAAGTTGVFVALSKVFTRCVGELALLTHSGDVRVSTLTFMGRRKDITTPANRIVPYSDTANRLGSPLQRLEITNSPHAYWYSVRYGKVLDVDLMTSVTGIPNTPHTTKTHH